MTEAQQPKGEDAQEPTGDPAHRGAPDPARYAGLLTQVMSNTLDEDYRTVAESRAAGGDRGRSRRGLWGVVTGLVLFGVLIGVAALSTKQDQPRLEAEREELIDQIQAREAKLDGLQDSIGLLREEITVLQENVADEVESSSALSRRLDSLSVAAGTVPVEGPGMSVTVDDAPGAVGSSGGVIRDQDLQSLVNGLWAAGAEAIALNGHRLTALTAIRFAGQAITVDFQSISPPYVVEAIGNPETLPAELAQTEGGQLWSSLALNFGIRYDYETEDSITLPGDPHDHLNYAERAPR
jgi:uncharacterized protein YlxW (UPF0749 family)